MNKEVKKLVRRLSDQKPGLVSVYAADGDCPDALNNGYSMKAIKTAINSVELSEIVVRNTLGIQLAWYLVSSGEEGIIDDCGRSW